MATGLSLVCEQCGAQLRSAKEAQTHADVSGHTNFSESTEPVLNLVCTTCAKPCRSKTETDLHTKRTGHAEFTDKTEEAAEPIQFVQERTVGGGTAEQPAAVVESQNEMVVPSVSKEVQSELEAMGFSTARAIRALHFSGGSSVEAAVNWIVEHEDDPDIDEMPMVPAATEEKQPLSAEEARARAQELRERARKKKEEEERRMEREREKERIRVGREILEAKRIEEDQERKRIIALRKAEKDEEKRAREKILARLQEDKEERRRKLGLPPEEPVEEATSTSSETEKKKTTVLPVRPISKAEQMRECLRGLKQAHQGEDVRVKKAFQTLFTFVCNVVQKPDEEKFRRIRLNNPAFQERVGSLKNGVEFLQLCGFEKDDSGEYLFVPRDKVDPVLLNAAGAELNSAIVNPFFGIL